MFELISMIIDLIKKSLGIEEEGDEQPQSYSDHDDEEREHEEEVSQENSSENVREPLLARISGVGEALNNTLSRNIRDYDRR